MLSKPTTLMMLAATAFTASASIDATANDYVFSVTGFTSVCTASTCYYGFNVSAPAGPEGAPAFTATGCGRSSVDPFKSCATVGIDTPGDVEVMEANLGRDVGANVFVKLSWRKDDAAFTLTGNQTVKHTGSGSGASPLDFTITPNAITGVL